MKSNCTTHASTTWPFLNFIVGHMHSSKCAASTMGWCAETGASNTRGKSTLLTTDGAMGSAPTSISRILPVISPSLYLLLSRSSAHALHVCQCIFLCEFVLSPFILLLFFVCILLCFNLIRSINLAKWYKVCIQIIIVMMDDLRFTEEWLSKIFFNTIRKHE